MKIRTAQEIPFTRMNDAHRPAVRRHRARAIEITAQPDFLQQLFRKRKRAVESLNFSDGGSGVFLGSRATPASVPDGRKLDKRALSPTVFVIERQEGWPSGLWLQS